MSKLALITGANKGIGLETAHQLGREGFHVLVGARDAKAVRAAPAARIVNLSSILASLALHVDPKSPIYHSQSAAYNASKTALNAWTVKVNAAHPGHVQTDMGGASAPMGIVDGAKSSVALATLGADGPSGTFTHMGHMGKTLPW